MYRVYLFVLVNLFFFLGCGNENSISVISKENSSNRNSHVSSSVSKIDNRIYMENISNSTIELDMLNENGEELFISLENDYGIFHVDNTKKQIYILPSPYLKVEPTYTLVVNISNGVDVVSHEIFIEIGSSLGREKVSFVEHTQGIISNEYLEKYNLPKNSTFALLETSSYELFTIDPLTGVIRSKSSNLDREEFYTLYLQVQVEGEQRFKISLEITLEDINDNAPTITSEETINVNENVDYAFTIITYDPDSGYEGNYSYSLSGDDKTFFTVDEEGDVYFKDGTDFETKNKYSLTVHINDGKYSASKNLVLSVVDNDYVINREIYPSSIRIIENETAVETSSTEVPIYKHEVFEVDYTGASLDSDGDYFVGSYSYSKDNQICGQGLFYKIDENLTKDFTYVNDSKSECSHYFANSVAISGNYVLFSSASVNGAELHEIDENGLISKVTEISTGGIGERFIVAIDGEYITIGDLTSQKVLIYKIEESEEVSFITSIEVPSGEKLEKGLSIYSDYVAFQTVVDFSKDYVYFYKLDKENNQGVFITKLSDDSTLDWSDFGYTIDMNSEYLTIGAPLEKIEGFPLNGGAGAVYLYSIDTETDTLTRVDKIDNEEGDAFGFSVSIFNKTLAVGSLVGGMGLFQIENNTLSKIDNFYPYFFSGVHVSLNKHIVTDYIFDRDNNRKSFLIVTNEKE